MILSLMIYFDQWNFHRTVQFMHAFLACMWTCNVCPALYHEVEHMDVKLNKDEQLLLKMNHCLCMLCICITLCLHTLVVAKTVYVHIKALHSKVKNHTPISTTFTQYIQQQQNLVKG